MAEQRTHNRNVRPASKTLPVTDFRSTEALVDCPDCEFGTVERDCPDCHGDGCDRNGNPCRECKSSGVVWEMCGRCDGTGEVLASDVRK